MSHRLPRGAAIVPGVGAAGEVAARAGQRELAAAAAAAGVGRGRGQAQLAQTLPVGGQPPARLLQ